MLLLCKIFNMRYSLLFIIFFKFTSLQSQVFPSTFWNKPLTNSPTVTTTSISNIAIIEAASGGNVIGDGGGTILSKGVCWSLQPNPTISNSKTSDGSGLGSYSSQLSGLTPNTTYYLRSYVKNEFGTNYGSEISFTTKGLIGDAVLGGKIAYILQNGDPGYDPANIHGLIITNSDISGAATWGCHGTYITTNYIFGSGRSNTNSIVANCGEAGIAAKICADLATGGFHDWYLPSIKEWEKIYPNSAAIGMSLNSADYSIDAPQTLGNNGYWSSTQAQMGGGGSNAASDAKWMAYPQGDPNNTYDKRIGMRVRAVRSF